MQDHYTTVEVAQLLGLAVRSVQLMVDRGVLEAWKTPGGHRRITRASVDRFLAARNSTGAPPGKHRGGVRDPAKGRPALCILRIAPADSPLDTLQSLVSQHLPQAELHMAEDGIAGLALVGQLEPDLLLVDLMLPGIDGRQLVASLHSHPQFRRTRVAIVTDLDEAQRAGFSSMLTFATVLRKSRLAEDLPPLLSSLLGPSSPDSA
jgi:excisionase family DNA binding protein